MSENRSGSQSSGCSAELTQLLSRIGEHGHVDISRLMEVFYGGAGSGSLETSRVLEERPERAADLIRLANRVHYGAGIPVTSIEAATVRMGLDRIKALSVVHEMFSATAGRGGGVDGDFLARSIMRGCLARALAMNARRVTAGEAFIVGAVQDLGIGILAASQGDGYRKLLTEADGDGFRVAVLEWQMLRFNHIHVVLELLRRWSAPESVLNAVGRHHTNPPLCETNDAAMRLWQIAFLVGVLPLGHTGRTGDGSEVRGHWAMRSFVAHQLLPALSIRGGRLDLLMRQAVAEYEDVAELFKDLFVRSISTEELIGPLARYLGVDGLSMFHAGPAEVIDGKGRRKVGISREIGADRRIVAEVKAGFATIIDS